MNDDGSENTNSTNWMSLVSPSKQDLRGNKGGFFASAPDSATSNIPMMFLVLLVAAAILISLVWGGREIVVSSSAVAGSSALSSSLLRAASLQKSQPQSSYPHLDHSVIKVAVAGQDYEESWGIGTMRRQLQCRRHLAPETERPVPTLQDWAYLRRVYQDTVQTKPTMNDRNENAFRVPYELRHDPVKGRGIYATTPIQKGTVIWTRAQSYSITSGADFRRFIFSIDNTDGLACDVLLWWYVFEQKDGHHEIVFDLNDGALMNNSGSSQEPNNGCFPKHDNNHLDCFYHQFAIQDIAAGDEMTARYKDFEVPGGRQALLEFGIPMK